MSGKGSRPRPYSVSQDQFATNWDAIFGRGSCDADSNKTDSEQDRVTRYNQETQQVKSTDKSQGQS